MSKSTEIIADNNPNNDWGERVIEVVVKQWKYQKTFITRVGGNCHGFTIMETAVEQIFEGLIGDDGTKIAEIVMTNDEGNTLLCTDDEEREDEWLKKMVVSCRIIDFEPPTLNEIRKMNGAKPVKDGDKPYVALGS